MNWIDTYNAVKKTGASIRVVPTRPMPRIIPNRTAPNKVVPVNNNIQYLLNDPTNPIIKNTTLPPMTSPIFSVVGYSGGGQTFNSANWQSANVYMTVANMINYISSIVHINRWAATSSLVVRPRAGRDLNAYYDRASLNFFFGLNPRTGKDIFTANSTDVVAHELGHAILDSFRPQLWGAPYLEAWAFHEAFGDIMAFTNMTLHNETIQQMLNETGNDIKQDNLISRLAEEVGNAISAYNSGQSLIYLRNVDNNFKYALPTTLPTKGNPETIYAEPHSFSRIMSGTIYEIFVMIYNDLVSKGSNRIDAVKNANKTIIHYLIVAVQNAIIEPRYFKRIAHAILWVDFNNGRVYHDRMYNIFLNRNIISELDVLADVEFGPSQTIKLSEHIFTCSDNPMHHCEIHVPHYHPCVIADVQKLVDCLQDMENEPFVISNGKLARNYFMCGCKSCGPSRFSPEFTKPYKPQNNTGCGCQQKKKDIIPAKPEVRRGCAIRYKTT